jgi:hypothetical protein
MLTANVEPVVKTTNLNLQFSVSPRPTAPLVSPKTYCTDYNEISADNGQNHENIGFFGLRPGRYRHSDYLAGRGKNTKIEFFKSLALILFKIKSLKTAEVASKSRLQRSL